MLTTSRALPMLAQNSSQRTDSRLARQSSNRRPTNRSTMESTKTTDKCGQCGYPGHVEADCRTKVKEQCMINNLLIELNKTKHQAHSVDSADHSNGD